MKKSEKFIFWAPRLLSIIYIIFLSLFSLDIFETETGILNILTGLFMHNIPSIILLVVLLISWKHELFGAVSFILFGIFYIIRLTINRTFETSHIFGIILIAGPAILIGALLLIAWLKKTKRL